MKKILLILFMLIFLSGCNETFITINQPNNATLEETILISGSVQGSPSGGSSFGNLAIKVPNEWIYVNGSFNTTCYPNITYTLLLNDSIGLDASTTYGNDSNYKWIGLKTNIDIFDVGCIYNNTKIYIIANSAGNYMLDYAVGNDADGWTDYDANHSINVTAPQNTQIRTFPSISIYSYILIITLIFIFI